MTVTIPATRMPSGSTPTGVAGAAGVDMHELPASKFTEVCLLIFLFGARRAKKKKKARTHPPHFQTESGFALCMDALGAESAADVELAVFDADGGHPDICLKVGSGAKTLVKMPPGADPTSCEGVLEAGQFKVSLAKAK